MSKGAEQRSLTANFAINLAGQVLPLTLALLFIPRLMELLGRPAFGLLSIAWVTLGYFGLFDLGLSRTLTRRVAAATGSTPFNPWPVLWAMAILGTLGGLLLAAASPWLSAGLLGLPAGLREDATVSFRLIATVLPFVVVTSGLVGLLEGHRRFDLTNLARLPVSLVTYAGAWLAVGQWGPRVQVAVAVIVGGRLITFLLSAAFAFRYLGRDVHRSRATTRLADLLREGAWFTGSSILSPLMVNLDRFLISRIVGIGSVAFYTTPYELVTKLWVLPSSLMGVMFPRFSALVRATPNELRAAVLGTLRTVFYLLALPTLWLVAFADLLLGWWIDDAFAARSAGLMRILALGVFMNSFAHAPYALLQSSGRADIPAKLHLIELPLYLLAVFALGGHFGLPGIAWAWLARVVVDGFLLILISSRMFPEARLPWRFGAAFATAVLCMAAVIPVERLGLRALIVAALSVAFLVSSWHGAVRPLLKQLGGVVRGAR